MPLYDYRCEDCGTEDERYVAVRALADEQYCRKCGYVATRQPYGNGVSRKTAVFPFTSTHIDGTGKPIVVESLGHLRRLESTYGVMATAFSQEPNNQDTPRDLPEFREGGRAFEGERPRDAYARQRKEAVARAVRNMELRKYARRITI